MHPLLAEALEKFKAGTMSQQEYDAERQRILRDVIGIGEALPVAPAPAAPQAMIEIMVKDKATREAEDARVKAQIERARKEGRLQSHVPRPEQRTAYVAKSVTVTENGETFRRVLTDAEIKAAITAQTAKAAVESRPLPMPSGSTVEIPRGFEVIGGILRPIPKTTTHDPIVEAVRARFKAGEFGPPGSSEAQAKAREEIGKLRSDKPDSRPRTACPLCKGSPDKITGKVVCPCKGKGWIALDVDSAIDRASRGSGCVDPLPENPEAVTYTAFLTSGGCTTIHAENGTKAIRGACESLRSAATGFDRIVLDNGVMLVLHQYQTQCPACHGTQKCEGKTCTQCVEGKVDKIGGRFYFADECSACHGRKFKVSEDEQGRQTATPCKACNETGRNPSPAMDRAHEAGLMAMTGWDPERSCGRKKCKGKECYACRDAQKGGYQRMGYIRCGECKGTGKIQGEDHQKCRGKGYFNTTEFFWIDSQQSFSVTSEIRRVDLIREDLAPKRDRHVAIKIGSDTVMVGAGAVPSRKSGAIMHLTGTARNKYDTAQKVYGSQEIRKGRDGKTGWSHRPNQGVGFLTSVHNDRSTFSDG